MKHAFLKKGPSSEEHALKARVQEDEACSHTATVLMRMIFWQLLHPPLLQRGGSEYFVCILFARLYSLV